MNLVKNSLYINILNFLINTFLFLFVLKNLDVNEFYLFTLYLFSFFLVFYSFNYKTIFFEKFLSIFLWLGFPFKLAIPYVALNFGYDVKLFPEISSNLNFSKQVYDDAILFASCGIFGFICASIIRKKFLFYYPKKANLIRNNLYLTYKKHKSSVLIFFSLIFLLTTFLNLYFEIYQKGISSEFSSKILVNIFKWLLLMGLSSFTCLFVYYDIVNKKNLKFSSFIFLLESFFSNISTLSRSFVFNVGLLFLIYFYKFKNNFKTKLPTLIVIATLAIILIFININISSKLRACVVNYLDITKSEKIFFSKNCLGNKEKIVEQKKISTIKKISSLSISRWVGIDSMMAIMNNKSELSFEYYKFFLKEKKINNEKSYYEKYFLNHSKKADRIINTNHLILPGFISYQSITGSKIFVFLSCFLLGLMGAYLEKISYIYSYNNFVISAFISYLFVFRMIHFGYIPSNTFVYLLSIIFTFLQFRVYEYVLSKLRIEK